MYNQAKQYLMKMRSSSHKYSLIGNQGMGRSYYGSPFACYLDICFWIRFQSNFPTIANFGIQTLFFNFNKTLFDMRSLCNSFLRCTYVTADARLKQKTLQSALVSFFFCMLWTVTTFLSSYVINFIPNVPSNTPKT